MENNILISYYMGGVDYEESFIAFKESPNPFSPQCLYRKDRITDIDKECYHNSWDWLMPVVDKIEEENYTTISFDVVDKKRIDNVYERVIKAIKNGK